MADIKSLLLLWKNKKTSQYYHVATLYFDGQNYSFHYTHHNDLHRKVKDALRNGYRLHPVFPELEKEYKSTSMFPAFDRRIPSKDRVDYDSILKDLGLPNDAGRMDILRETRGMLSGDAYSFVEPLRLYNERHLETSFYMNGMRHRNLAEDWPTYLELGDTLVPVPEDDNPMDPHAVRLENKQGLHLGYVPAVYAEAVKSLVHHGIELTLTIIDIRPDSAPQWWVQLELTGDLNMHEQVIFDDIQLNGLILKTA